MKPIRLAPLAVAILLAACTTSPTDPARLDPAAPSFDGGTMLDSGEEGSGTSTTEQGGNTLGSGNFTSDSTSTESGRGGNTLGSGN